MWPFRKRRVSALIAPELFGEVQATLDRLADEGNDGREYRIAVRHWGQFARPIVEQFTGDLFQLFVEGPMESLHGLDYPLGAHFSDQNGWRWLDPIQTCSFVRALRAAQDQAVEEWLTQREIAESSIPRPRAIIRDVDDLVSIARIQKRANVMIHFSRQLRAQ